MALPSELATTGHERLKALYNFSLPNLWGTQRHMRCRKAHPDGGGSSYGDQQSRRRYTNFGFSNWIHRRLKAESSEKEVDDEGIKEFREMIMSDLKNAADKMTESIVREQALGDDKNEIQREEAKGKEASPPEAPGSLMEKRPWNLRKRRAACETPIQETDANQYNNHKGLGIDEKKRVNPSCPWIESEKDRAILFYTLSKKEIEEDYMKVLGHRPPRRPTKRPRAIQKQINLLNPASYIFEITSDLYKVSDQAEKRKRW